MKNLILFIIWILSPTTLAYIPSYSMILSHLAAAQGNGVYRIEQTINFQNSTNSLSLTEIWWIAGNNQLRLDVKPTSPNAKNLYLRFIYQNPYKIFNNEKGQRQKARISIYHIDKPFHLRSANRLKRLFHLWKLAPRQRQVDKQDSPPTNDFIRLDRRQGIVQYHIAQNKTHAQLWLEQDEFIIREWEWIKNRNKLSGKLIAWDYVRYPGNLFFPTHRRFIWPTTEIHIKVKKVQKIANRKKIFHLRHLRRKNHIPTHISPSDQNNIREFYKQFR